MATTVSYFAGHYNVRMSGYQPPFGHNSRVVSLVAEVAELVGKLSMHFDSEPELKLRRINRIRSVTGSLAIEGNNMSVEQVTALLAGRRVLAPPRELREIRNALAAYDRFTDWDGREEEHLLTAHEVLMAGLLDQPGRYRRGGVGVLAGSEVLHMAPQAKMVPGLMQQLFGWLRGTEEHPLVASSIFQYELEFIHPFEDGNGRIGRLWQTLLLSHWQPALAWLPIESLVHRQQEAYYQAIQSSTEASDSAHFVQFMLECILAALEEFTPQGTPQVTPQVEQLLQVLQGSMARQELQDALGLEDREHFRSQRYRLTPAGLRLRE